MSGANLPLSTGRFWDRLMAMADVGAIPEGVCRWSATEADFNQEWTPMPYVEQPGCRLFYSVVDVTPPWVEDPPTIVFHHGVSVTSDLWSDWIPALCNRCRLVMFDTRGFGKSAPHATDIPWTIELMVGDLLAVAGAAGLKRFHLVGESAGGTAALAAAISHPDRIKTLTISNGAHDGTAIQNVRGVWSERLGDAGRDEWADQMMEWRFFPDSIPAAQYNWFRNQQITCSATATTAIAALLLRTNLTEQVCAIKAPTLIFSPDSSPFIPVRLLADLHARIVGSELQVFPHARHGLPLSHGRECASSLLRFIERHSSAAIHEVMA